MIKELFKACWGDSLIRPIMIVAFALYAFSLTALVYFIVNG